MVRPEISISLNKVTDSYSPGEQVSGMVHVICVDDHYPISSLIVTIRGYAIINWEESQTRERYYGNRKHYETYYVKRTHEEVYFTRNIPLINPPVTSNIGVALNRGRNEYQFNYNLPTDIPSSYENVNGSIIYEVTVNLKEYSWFGNTATKKFWVTGIINLSNEPMASEPVNREQESTVCCFCCKTGPINLNVNLRRMGYLPGEYIDFCARIINSSSCKLTCKAQLIEQAEFRRPSTWLKTSSRTIVTVLGPIVPKDSTQVWDRRSLLIPNSVTPTRLGGYCTIIDVRHFLVIDLIIGGRGLFSSLQIKLPVIIGTTR